MKEEHADDRFVERVVPSLLSALKSSAWKIVEGRDIIGFEVLYKTKPFDYLANYMARYYLVSWCGIPFWIMINLNTKEIVTFLSEDQIPNTLSSSGASDEFRLRLESYKEVTGPFPEYRKARTTKQTKQGMEVEDFYQMFSKRVTN